MNKAPPEGLLQLAPCCCCSPEGIRTLVADLRSQSPRPLDDGALVHFFTACLLLGYCAGVPGLEPRLTEPESAGLPITPYPNYNRGKNTPKIKALSPLKFEPATHLYRATPWIQRVVAKWCCQLLRCELRQMQYVA